MWTNILKCVICVFYVPQHPNAIEACYYVQFYILFIIMDNIFIIIDKLNQLIFLSLLKLLFWENRFVPYLCEDKTLMHLLPFMNWFYDPSKNRKSLSKLAISTIFSIFQSYKFSSLYTMWLGFLLFNRWSCCGYCKWN